MKTTDKWLLIIVSGIVLLVIAAFVITLTRPEANYLPDDFPGNAAHNYLLAVQNEDYPRAYEYLSPTLTGYPASAAEFEQDIRERPWSFRDDYEVRLKVLVEDVIETNDRAYVDVQESRFYQNSIFSSSQSIRTFEMKLQFEYNAWKILDADRYFINCWKNKNGC